MDKKQIWKQAEGGVVTIDSPVPAHPGADFHSVGQTNSLWGQPGGLTVERGGVPSPGCHCLGSPWGHPPQTRSGWWLSLWCWRWSRCFQLASAPNGLSSLAVLKAGPETEEEAATWTITVALPRHAEGSHPPFPLVCPGAPRRGSWDWNAICSRHLYLIIFLKYKRRTKLLGNCFLFPPNPGRRDLWVSRITDADSCYIQE